MFNTIFSKLIAVFIAVLLFSFSITGVILYVFLGNSVISEKVELLKQSGDKINNFFNIYIENRDNPLVRLSFEQVLKSYSEYTDSIVWIVDSSGYIILSWPELPKELKQKMRDDTGYPKLTDERQYKSIMSGKEPFIRETGDFYGFFKNNIFKTYGNSWLTIEKPLMYDNEIYGAVYLHTPTPEVQKARTSVFKFFLLAVAISVLVSILLVYVFSIRITRPLKEISNAARIISGGEFNKRLDINSEDEIGELAKSFNQMITALQNLEEMRRGFIANVSHELRTPMTSIRGFIEGILDGTIPVERQRDYLIIVKDETNRLNRLVNDLLDLAKMEAGEMQLNLRSFNINELIRRCVIKLESLIVQKNISIEANFDEEDIYVNADSDAIERVIINLIHNAIKFTSEKGKITLSTSRQKDKVVIAVADNGVGIDKDEIDLIWDRFYKSDKSRSKDKTGTGLGLAIIKNIINEHKQSIWVESEIGVGTKFTFTLEKGR